MKHWYRRLAAVALVVLLAFAEPVATFATRDTQASPAETADITPAADAQETAAPENDAVPADAADPAPADSDPASEGPEQTAAPAADPEEPAKAPDGNTSDKAPLNVPQLTADPADDPSEDPADDPSDGPVETTAVFVLPAYADEDITYSEEVYGEYDRTAGEPVGTLPQAPFREGFSFVKWVNAADETQEVTGETVVPEGGLRAVAVFDRITIYDVVMSYYYVIDGRRIDFGTETYEIQAADAAGDGYEITVPSSTRVSEEYDAAQPVYYPEEPAVTVTEAMLADAVKDPETQKLTLALEVKYVEYTAIYDFVYYLKNTDGNGYTEIERESGVEGVFGSVVAAPVRTYDYAELERADAVEITQATGQEVPAYYTRRTFTLTFDTKGGSYVASQTVPYETQVSLSDRPTRTGYTFAGWFTDEACTEAAGSSYTVLADTTLHAKWEAAPVSYTIVYMMEKYDNATGTTTFEYDRSRTAQAPTGTTVTAAQAPDLTNNVNGYEKDTERNADSQVVVAADGTSVLTVYYKLIRYTLSFTHRTRGFGSSVLKQGGTWYTTTN